MGGAQGEMDVDFTPPLPLHVPTPAARLQARGMRMNSAAGSGGLYKYP